MAHSLAPSISDRAFVVIGPKAALSTILIPRSTLSRYGQVERNTNSSVVVREVGNCGYSSPSLKVDLRPWSAQEQWKKRHIAEQSSTAMPFLFLFHARTAHSTNRFAALPLSLVEETI
ncbi:hypothetical protein J5N97_013992 [Dioscorea zingiberensis]|uniref:Uncharacterized protein n=1 Tax=Dioscorea zingiberensis TaxID=325984 RepID=A0A9D5CU92_9LILI|nr:hypothetical protein J5N97_013992 [Dioscorea zingiberensis]